MKQEHSALVSSKYDKLPREAKKTNDSTFDRIYKYYHNNKTRVELTAEEITIRTRWEKAWYLMCQHRTKKQVVDILEKLFSIGKSVAYDDVRCASMLFSDPQTDTKEAKRAIAESMALRGADKCWKNGDMEGYFKFLKAYAEINQLDAKEVDGLADLVKKLRPTQIIIKSSSAELQAEEDALMQQVSDIEHEVVE